MENPIEDIKSVVQQLTATDSPRHPEGSLRELHDARRRLPAPRVRRQRGPQLACDGARIYQCVFALRGVVLMLCGSCVDAKGCCRWYRVLSPRIEIKLDSIGTCFRAALF